MPKELPDCTPTKAAKYLIEVTQNTPKLISMRRINQIDCYLLETPGQYNFASILPTLKGPYEDGSVSSIIPKHQGVWREILDNMRSLGLKINVNPRPVEQSLSETLKQSHSVLSIVICSFHSELIKNPMTQKVSGHTFMETYNVKKDVPHYVYFVGINTLASDKAAKTVAYHEFGHGLGLFHYPPTYTADYPACVLTDFEKRLKEVRGLQAELQCKHRPNTEESSVMYCIPHINNSSSLETPFDLPPVDRIAFKKQYDIITSKGTSTSPKEELPLIEQPQYNFLSDPLVKSFISAFVSTTVRECFIRRVEFRLISQDRLEEALNFAISLCFYGLPVAVFSKTVSYAMYPIMARVRSNPDYAYLSPYIEPLLWVILNIIWEQYNSKTLLQTLESAAQITYAMITQFISSLFGTLIAQKTSSFFFPAMPVSEESIPSAKQQERPGQQLRKRK